jgi:NADH:ubiquinone oxidoreductase subunit F (NADH-binding)
MDGREAVASLSCIIRYGFEVWCNNGVDNQLQFLVQGVDLASLSGAIHLDRLLECNFVTVANRSDYNPGGGGGRKKSGMGDEEVKVT